MYFIGRVTLLFAYDSLTLCCMSFIFVYRLIDAALIGTFLMIPSYFKIKILVIRTQWWPVYNKGLTECGITIELLHYFFSDTEVILSSHTMFINTSTKEFIRVNNAIPSYDIPFKQLLNYKMVTNVN